MARSKKSLLAIAALIIIAIVVIAVLSKEDVSLDEVTMECPSILMAGAPTITDYGKDFVLLQTLSQKKLHIGQSYRFEHIIFGPPYKVKLALTSDDNQRNYLVTIEENYAAPSENTYLRWIKYDCKHTVDISQKSLLSDISLMFVNFDSASWEISDAIEMFSSYEQFQSNAIYHYIVFIKGEFRKAPENSAKFDTTVDVLFFAAPEDAQRYYRLQNDILKRNAYGYREFEIDVAASEHESYCYRNSRISADTGCIFIGRLDDMIVEMKLFPQDEKANLEQVKMYWPVFVNNLWPSVLDNYGAVLKAP